MTTVRIAEIADVIRGVSWNKNEASDQPRDGYLPILRAGNIGDVLNVDDDFVWVPSSNVSAVQSIRAGDIAICMSSGSASVIGKTATAKIDWPGSVGAFCGLIRAHANRCLPEYLGFYLKSQNFRRWTSEAQGANIKNIRKSALEDFMVLLPLITEQRRIVDILSRAEGIVRLRREAQKKAAEIIPALFVDMFGDPGTNPKGWQFVTIGDLVHAAQDGPHVSPSYVDDGIPFISTRHVKRGQVFFQDLKFLSLQEAEIQWKKCKPVKGDILYTKGGTTGIAAEIDFDKEIAVWVHVALLKTNHAIVSPTWLESMLNSDFCYQQSQELTHGIANRDLGLKRMVKIRAYLPPIELQRQFARSVKDIKSIQAQQVNATQKAEATFNALLARTFSAG